MDFKEATDRLMERGLTAEDLAGGLGLAAQTVRAMRLDPSASAFRNPPAEWRPKLAELARARGGDLLRVAEELDQAGEAS